MNIPSLSKLGFPIILFSLIICLASSCKNEDEPSADCTTPIETAEQSTNPEIEAMRQAMLNFRSSLPTELLQKASTCLADDRVTRWSNLPIPILSREGILYGDLSTAQLDKFKAVLQLFLSAEGYQKVQEITTLAEGYLETLDDGLWSPNLYSIDMFGDPATIGSWGFQLDGHHCAINFLVHGDEVSMVPAFLGGEPVIGNFNNTSFDILKDERELALGLYNGMTNEELNEGVSDGNSETMVLAPPSSGRDKYRGDYDYSQFTTGLKYSDMSPNTQANMVLLMKEYVYNLSQSFADIWWADVMENINDTYFVWLDNVDMPTATTQFYYRIYNPYLWAEYNMESPVGDGVEEWNHAHTITRIPNNPSTKNGGDYGIFAQIINNGGPRTLLEHYMSADHHKGAEMQFDYEIQDHSHHKHKHKHKHKHNHTHDHSHHDKT